MNALAADPVVHLELILRWTICAVRQADGKTVSPISGPRSFMSRQSRNWKLEDFQHSNITDQKKMNKRGAGVGSNVLHKLYP